MNYIQISFCINPYEEYLSDILSGWLAEIGFESFESIEGGLNAYIQESLFRIELLEELVKQFDFNCVLTYNIEEIASKNWNEEWEKNFFEPIVIGDECVIHSSFHRNIPLAKYDIIIDPKMAFGTGHHETTSLVISEILSMNLTGKSVLDMGCGTAVLAILASMRGAEKLLAIDIDSWCTENSLENIEINHIKNIEVKLADASLLKGLQFDIILANINRNILLADIEKYAQCLTSGGELFMSGFYKEDIPMIEAEANRQNLRLVHFRDKNNWVVVKTIKN